MKLPNNEFRQLKKIVAYLLYISYIYTTYRLQNLTAGGGELFSFEMTFFTVEIFNDAFIRLNHRYVVHYTNKIIMY